MNPQNTSSNNLFPQNNATLPQNLTSPNNLLPESNFLPINNLQPQRIVSDEKHNMRYPLTYAKKDAFDRFEFENYAGSTNPLNFTSGGNNAVNLTARGDNPASSFLFLNNDSLNPNTTGNLGPNNIGNFSGKNLGGNNFGPRE
jgi:hypothetical protein